MMPFTTHTGIAAPMLRDNIDTDQIIPSREMKSVTKTGLGDGLFAGQRYLKDRVPNPDFILNQSIYKDATILLSGKNFGCGSSREHAVWALEEYGFRAIIAASFGDIFYNNCVRNGVLCVQMEADFIAERAQNVTIDLQKNTVDGVSFDIHESDKAMLIGGLDSIAMTLKHEDDIAGHIKRDKTARPWVY